MYKDDGAALRAHLEAVEAELVAERKRREAVEAERDAAVARVNELELQLARPPAEKTKPRGTRAIAVASAIAGGLMILIVIGLLALTHRDAPPRLGQSDTPAAAELPIPYSPAAAKPDLALPEAGPPLRVTASELLSEQRKHRPALQACYDQALRRDPTLTEVKVEVELTIADNGNVSRLQVRGAERELERCLSAEIRSWRLPPHGGQTFSFPIIFRGN